MLRFTSLRSLLLGLTVFGVSAGAPNLNAQEIGDFSGLWSRGSVSQSHFRLPESGPGPVVNLFEVPPEAAGGAGIPNQGDHTNPILQPWAAEVVLRHAEADRMGRPELPAQNLCRPHGVPYILQINDTVQFLQSPTVFAILYAREMRTRRIHMNVAHPNGLAPSIYGHSIGHWDGDTLVIDTIGLTDDTWTDKLGTPHTDQLHVVERYRKISEDEIRVDLAVEDPGAFTTPWSAYVTYSRTAANYVEQVCAENNINTLTGLPQDIPMDATPDF